MDFAERLSLWLNAFDAIDLQACHQALKAAATAAPAQPSAARRTGTQGVAEDFQRVRAVLAKAIAKDPLALEPPSAEPAYAPYHQRHLELQRQMEQMITALRDHVRQAICRVSPRLRQLAVVDAAFEQVLARREQTLLPAAAALLKRRFEQLRNEEGGLKAFASHWQEALLAELDLRLEPVAGLVDALTNESGSPPARG
jgi:hypothetical protein